MPWAVDFHPAFDPEFDGFTYQVKTVLLAKARLLEEYGPALGRPNADTLNGSRHSNMKELRFNADRGVWRVAFAFDPNRRGILLTAGDKSGVSEALFYQSLLAVADDRFCDHLAAVRSAGG